MRLYKIEMEVYVVAKDKDSAYSIATDIYTEIPRNDCCIWEATCVPAKWSNAVPWGSKDDKTCNDFLAAT